jgi:ribosomal protein S14
MKNNYLTKSKCIYIKLSLVVPNLFLKKKNICALSGENNSVRKKLLISRFNLNKLGVNNKLQNFKINS